ncbi:DUF1513 domain-containing protein [Aestuariispira insulae]|uniref:DUF1513 domain-containing protein n=1 Tax=Aestuariispira insulae TaxID=1461337 RepID=A0A3D9HJM7_9PROT|nr:DUF1513 domain-containing protein [Aestuariispira insulae]RED49635.1 hypothetical protein DFP90_1055 [Aestuariispira insulae]
MLTRREMLKQAITAACLAPAAGYMAVGEALAGTVHHGFVSAYADQEGAMKLALIEPDGTVARDWALPARGHAIMRRPKSHHVAAFARRPGRFLLVVDFTTGAEVARLSSPPDRHFYGHGTYSPDGRFLYTTENDYIDERGVIGVWDAIEGYRRIGELSAHGLGPHELLFLPDGETLVVAVGGILTHPDEGRAKLNIPEMSPALVYMNARSGQLVSRHQLPQDLHKLSLRHLCVNAAGRVCFGLQNEGPKSEFPPLVGFHDGTGDLRLLEAPLEIWQGMKNYCGSVAYDQSGTVAGASSPRGSMISFWNIETGRHLYAVTARDGCGLAADTQAGRFIATCGTGEIMRIDVNRQMAITLRSPGNHDRRWDNHLLAL